MTCQDARDFIRNMDATGDFPPEFARHLELCEECRRLANAQPALAEGLQDLRDSAPAVPARLDSSILAIYRQQFLGAQTPAAHRGLVSLRNLGYATVAAMMILGIVLIAIRQHRQTPDESRAQRPAMPVSGQQVQEPPAEKAPVVPAVVAKHRQGQRRSPSIAARHSQSPNATAVAASDPRTSGFESLMYCDPLSCAGPMQVIRIQLPFSAVERVPAPRPSNGLVQADVVVGSDGVARAIRIVR